MTCEDDTLRQTSANSMRAGMLESKRILIMVSDPVARHFLRRMMHIQGFECTDTAYGGEAIEDTGHHLPSIIIADCPLPNMDRIQFLEELVRQSPSHTVPIILLTGNDEALPSDREKALGVCAILKKPLDYRQMSSVVASITSE